MNDRTRAHYLWLQIKYMDDNDVAVDTIEREFNRVAQLAKKEQETAMQVIAQEHIAQQILDKLDQRIAEICKGAGYRVAQPTTEQTDVPDLLIVGDEVLQGKDAVDFADALWNKHIAQQAPGKDE